MAKRRYFKQLRVAQFRAIIELSRGKGFASAAAALDLSTPSVWQQVRALEDEFGVPLIDVVGQQVSLTAQGRLLVELAEPVVHGFDSIVEQFTRQSRSIPRRLIVASPGDILVNELPVSIQSYYEKFNDIELSLIDVASNPARKLLEDGDVDLAIVGQLDTSYPSTLIADPVTWFPFMLVGPVDHPVLQLKRISPKNLAKYPLVMSSAGTNTRRRVNEVFAKADLLDNLRVVCETSTKELQLQFVRFGFGIAIMPISPHYRGQPESAPDPKLGFRDVSAVFGEEQIVILRRRHRLEPAHQKAFREIVLASI